MHYKTIMLELLEARPILRHRLETHRLMIPTLDYYSLALKAAHQRWMRTLAEGRPDSDRGQLASEALELAIEEVREHLPSFSQVGDETFSPERWREQVTIPSSAG